MLCITNIHISDLFHTKFTPYLCIEKYLYTLKVWPVKLSQILGLSTPTSRCKSSISGWIFSIRVVRLVTSQACADPKSVNSSAPDETRQTSGADQGERARDREKTKTNVLFQTRQEGMRALGCFNTSINTLETPNWPRIGQCVNGGESWRGWERIVLMLDKLFKEKVKLVLTHSADDVYRAVDTQNMSNSNALIGSWVRVAELGFCVCAMVWVCERVCMRLALR